MKKIPNVFERDWNGDKSRVLNIPVEESLWVLGGGGIATRKWDGTACLVENGVLFKRYDAKHGKPAPAGFWPAQDPDPVTGHWPGWLETSDARPEDKWHREAWTALTSPLSDGTYELCGPKIGGNPEALSGHVFLKHGDVEYHIEDRSFRGIEVALTLFACEGFVFHHPDGPMAKVKRRDFGLQWPVASAIIGVSL